LPFLYFVVIWYIFPVLAWGTKINLRPIFNFTPRDKL
jgi:hypothetical protein